MKDWLMRGNTQLENGQGSIHGLVEAEDDKAGKGS